MELEHTLSIDAPITDVWAALIDPAQVVACMPGATLGNVDGETFDGQIKVKIGPVALLYKGVGTFVEKDEAARKVGLEANAKDSRGNGTAKVGIAITLTEDGDKTIGKVVTDLAVTGKPAQFGRGMLSDVGGKIIEQFADCLSNKLSAPAADPEPAADQTDAVTGSAPQAETEAPGAASAPSQAQQPQQEAEALDLMQYAGGSVAKRLGPVIAALVAGAVLFVVLRRLRR
ncbi:SRPBCC family protein [Aldersonia kunmingensis]|uniref:SRPBCC family protein n=1 Tax=Aldersonia kunmingensis TaxID=408066 RepID=UPI000832B4FC|nr:SRPBCC family protein [Aldersonia kunmingensis]